MGCWEERPRHVGSGGHRIWRMSDCPTCPESVLRQRANGIGRQHVAMMFYKPYWSWLWAPGSQENLGLRSIPGVEGYAVGGACTKSCPLAMDWNRDYSSAYRPKLQVIWDLICSWPPLRPKLHWCPLLRRRKREPTSIPISNSQILSALGSYPLFLLQTPCQDASGWTWQGYLSPLGKGRGQSRIVEYSVSEFKPQILLGISILHWPVSNLTFFFHAELEPWALFVLSRCSTTGLFPMLSHPFILF